MNNDELKKKIRKTILDTIYNYPDDAQHYNRWLFHVADALIAAGIGDVKESENKATAAEIVAQAAASTAIEKIEEWKHRAEVAERALRNLAQFCAKGAGYYMQSDETAKKREQELYDEWIKQAEKELAEERKDA